MKIAVLGGGISGLSTAYYLKKLLPLSSITIFEASSRFGGWIDSKKVRVADETVYFEKGPRTLRLSTGEAKELNSLKLARELNLDTSVDIVPNTHPAAKNRYILFNKKINLVEPKYFTKSPLFGQSLIKMGWNEIRIAPRAATIDDESIWSFIARRFNPTIADNLVDPIFKGICGGNIKNLSANALVKTFYNYERLYGSVLKGIRKNMKPKSELDFDDLKEMKQFCTNKSVWRLKNGTEELITKLVENLSNQNNVKLLLNEPIEKVVFDKGSSSIEIKSKSYLETPDIVISCISSLNIAHILPDEHLVLKSLLNQIKYVDIALINFYFDKDVLPVKGFGYLVPTNQDSSILGCIFDSIFNEPNKQNTVLTVMMGGAWFKNEWIQNQNSLVDTAFKELQQHLNLTTEPKYHELSILKNAIPQYMVGHEKLLNQINTYLVSNSLNDKFYLNGNSYEGVGVNDCIFNSRKIANKIHLSSLNK